MPKLAVLVAASLYTGGMVALGVVSIPNAMKAYESSRSVPFAAHEGLAAAALLAPVLAAPEPTTVVIDEVEVVGDANSAFRARMLKTRTPAVDHVVEPVEVATPPCPSAWVSMSSGPADRHYRPLCSNELEKP